MFKKTTTETTMEYLNKENTPIVYITPNSMMKMQAYVNEFDKEISWLGTVERTQDNSNLLEHEYLITDVMLFPQEVTATTTEMLEAALNDFGTKLVQAGDTKTFNQIKAWGHSHVNMGVSPSGTDNETFHEFYKDSDFFIRIICNKKEEIRIDIVDSNTHIMYMNVDWYEDKTEEQVELERIVERFNEKRIAIYNTIKQETKKEIEENIKQKTYTYQTYQGYQTYPLRYSDDDYPDYVPNEKKTYQTQKEIYLAKYWQQDDDVLSCTYESIDKIIDKETILNYAETLLDWRELKEELKDESCFKNYNNSDWEDLFDTFTNYYFTELYENKGVTDDN